MFRCPWDRTVRGRSVETTGTRQPTNVTPGTARGRSAPMATAFVARPARASGPVRPGPGTRIRHQGRTLPREGRPNLPRMRPQSPPRSRASSSGANGVGCWLPDPGHDCQSSYHRIEGSTAGPSARRLESEQHEFVSGRGIRGKREVPLHDGQHGSPRNKLDESQTDRGGSSAGRELTCSDRHMLVDVRGVGRGACPPEEGEGGT